MIEILDPSWGDNAAAFTAAAPLDSLVGSTVGIVSNGKKNTATFFEALADELRTTHSVAEVHLVVKGNYSAPAEDEVMDRAGDWNALISGIGD